MGSADWKNRSDCILEIEHISVNAKDYGNAFLLAKSTISPMSLPIVRGGICLSFALLAGSVIPLYHMFVSDLLLPIFAICFFVILAFIFVFAVPNVNKKSGVTQFHTNQFYALLFSLRFFKEYFLLINEYESIRVFWSEIDRSMENEEYFILLGSLEREMIVVSKKELQESQVEALSELLEERIGFRHKRMK